MQTTRTTREAAMTAKKKLSTVEEYHMMFEAGVFGDTDRARVELLFWTRRYTRWPRWVVSVRRV